jgi:hypothetical protein
MSQTTIVVLAAVERSRLTLPPQDGETFNTFKEGVTVQGLFHVKAYSESRAKGLVAGLLWREGSFEPSFLPHATSCM